MSQTLNIDTFTQNGIVKHNELLIGVSTKLTHLLKEDFTRDFLFVNVGTVFARNMKCGITHLIELLQQITFREHCPNYFGARSSNKNFRSITIRNLRQNTYNVFCIYKRCVLFSANGLCFIRHNFRRNDTTHFNKFSCRNTDDIITIHISIVHRLLAVIELWSCSKEIGIICNC